MVFAVDFGTLFANNFIGTLLEKLLYVCFWYNYWKLLTTTNDSLFCLHVFGYGILKALQHFFFLILK